MNLQMISTRQISILFLLAVLLPAGRQASARTSVKVSGVTISRKWIVHQTDIDLKKAAPKNAKRQGFITDEKSWGKLWKAWRKGDAPAIDFDKSFVLVLTAPENARVMFNVLLEDDGDLKTLAISTRRVSMGMTYALAVIPRDGVKSVNGVPLE